MYSGRFIAVLLISLLSVRAAAQMDTIITKDNNILVGEVKAMDRGVVTLKTSYSDKDFKIEWKGISRINTQSYFLITTSDGTRLLGQLQTDTTEEVVVTNADGFKYKVDKSDIVYLNEVEQGFFSRVYASIEFGWSFTRANNLQQITTRSSLGYAAERWTVGGSFNTLQSTQDSVDAIRRSDGEAFGKYFLPKDWFAILSSTFLSNSEQLLDLRSNIRAGLGKYVIHTNRSYWGFSAGAAYNIERFDSEEPERLSYEGYLGTELNLYDIGDLNLLTNLIVYPSITEQGRIRADGQFDAKYDFPLDFYIKVGFSVNFDNQPTLGASDLDYVFQTTLGWEW